MSLSGEDFVIRSSTGAEVMRVAGAQKIPGANLDRLAFIAGGKERFTVERRLVALTPSYDIYVEGKVAGKIEQQLIALTPTFVYEGKGGVTYRAEGSFSERRYVIKGKAGDVGQVQESLVEVSRDVNTYLIRIAAGVDVAAVLAMACVIDEIHDEKDAAEGKSEEWPALPKFPNPFG